MPSRSMIIDSVMQTSTAVVSTRLAATVVSTRLAAAVVSTRLAATGAVQLALLALASVARPASRHHAGTVDEEEPVGMPVGSCDRNPDLDQSGAVDVLDVVRLINAVQHGAR